jgi:hypothetical protein
VSNRYKVDQFEVADETGLRLTIIQYRVYLTSNEITGDRMGREPTVEMEFRTPNGRFAEEAGDGIFVVEGHNRPLRKV